ncbi:MAG TPA: hypothetical protein VLB50_06115 [Ignavibacteriaceae bacterium]|nr:hypothetical protein [Ignavibacteriaceae bacterium]
MDNTEVPKLNGDPPIGEVQTEEELSHTDKMVGVFAEPGTMYEKTSKFPPKTIDWLVPLIVMIIFSIISSYIVLSNPEIAYNIKHEQLAKIEKSFQDMVNKGQITKEQAQEQMSKIEERMEGGTSIVQTIVFTIVKVFLFFFIVTGIYFITARFIFKGEGTYASAMVANGLTAYIDVIQVILATILTISLGRLVQDTSIASLMHIEKSTFAGFFLGKLDIISIWSLAVVSIGLAKMFKSERMVKYFVFVFGLWIIWGLLIFGIGQAIPFLQFLGG